jgi:prevent-host-death family protein
MFKTNISNTFNMHNSWPLQDAKARLSELVRKAQEAGPQRVTIHGRDAVIVMSINEFERLQPPLTGQALVSALSRSLLADVEFERLTVYSPVRSIIL